MCFYNLLKVRFGHVQVSQNYGQQLGSTRGDMMPNTSTSAQNNHVTLLGWRNSEARQQSEAADFSQYEEDLIETGVTTLRMSLEWDKDAISDASTILSDERLRVVNTVQSSELRSARGSVLHLVDNLTTLGDGNGDLPSILCSSSQESSDCGQRGRQLKRTRSILLQEFITDAGYESTAELVAAYNHAVDENKRETIREWVGMYVKWFVGKKGAYVTAAAINEYASLIRIVPRGPEDKRLIKDILSSLAAQAKREGEELPGNRDSIAALSDALQVVDKDVFSDDLETLFDIASSVLLPKLDSSKTAFISETRAAHESTLLALHRVLFLIQLVAPHRLNPDQKGFYQTVQTRLDEISTQSTPFPITFQVETAKLTLQRLAQKRSMGMLRVLKCCVKGFLYLWSGVRHAIVADINVDSWERAYHELKQVCSSLRSVRRDWHDALMELNCAAQLARGDPEAQSTFEECFETLMKDQHQLATIEDRKFLAFGIVGQLRILATDDGPEWVRKKAIDEIMQLALTYTACDPCYGDPTIVEALLDALVHIYTSGACCDASERVLRTMIDDENKQIAVKKWLNGQTIDTKLQQEIADRRHRDSTELFRIVRRKIWSYCLKEDVADNEHGLGQIRVVKIHWSKQSRPAFTTGTVDNKRLDDCVKVKEKLVGHERNPLRRHSSI